MKSILLTGATGFVGTQIIKSLQNYNVNIIPVVRNGKESLFKDCLKIKKIISSRNIFKESEVWWKNKCKDVDVVIHAAWYVEPGKYLYSSRNLDCLIGSLNLVRGAINANISKFVGIGTCFEYDLTYKRLSVKTPLKPISLYAASKVSLFTILSQLLTKSSIKFNWCRLFYLYGEGEDKRRFIPYLHSQLSKNNEVDLTTGEQIRDYLNVSEAGKIISKVALGNYKGAINICSGKPVSIKQLAEKIADIYSGRDLLNFGARKKNLLDPPIILGVPNIKIRKNLLD